MKRKLLKTAVAAALSGFCLPGVLAQDAWDAPKVPGADLSGELSGTYALYNVGADAFVTHGVNWNTRAVAGRLFGGDAALDDGHKVTVTKTENTLQIHFNSVEDSKKYLGLADGVATTVYTDVNANNAFTFSNKGDGTFTLDAPGDASFLDVSTSRGWILTCSGGQNLTKWALIPEDSITNGNYATYKAKKEMYEIYETLTTAGTSGEYTDALATAKKAYDAAASADDVRAATAALLKAAALGLTADKVNASSLFTNADMVGAWKHTDWTVGSPTVNMNFADFENYWAGGISGEPPIDLLKQSQSGLPNGIYTVVLHGFYREDGSDAAPELTLMSGEAKASSKVPEREDIDFTVGFGDIQSTGNEVENPKSWESNKPNNIKDAGEAMAADGTTATVENFMVENGELAVSVVMNGKMQWINWQGFDIYFQAEDESSLKNILDEKVKELEALKDTAMYKGIKEQVNTALENAGKATSDTYGKSITEVEAAIDAAKESIKAYAKMTAAIDFAESHKSSLPSGADQSAYSELKGKYDGGEFTNEDVQKDENVRAIYEALATAAKSATYAEGNDYTLAILNNGFETGDLMGWTVGEVKYDPGETGVKPNGLNYAMPGAEGSYLFNSWGSEGNYGATLSQTVENLPGGVYKLGFLYGSDIDKKMTVIANGDTVTFTSANANTEAQPESLLTTVGTGGKLDITVIGGEANDAWYKVDNFTLKAVAETDLDDLKTYKTDKVEAAGKIDLTVNVGDGAFRKPESVAKGVTDAISSAGNAAETVNGLVEALKSLQTALEDFNNAELAEPGEGELFRIILVNSHHDLANHAVTFVEGMNQGKGNFALNYEALPNINYAQAFKFVKAEKANQYYLSFTDKDDTQRYACTGTVYEAETGDFGIRVTSEKEQALAFEVVASITKDSVYQLKNTAAGEYMGSRDKGFYTTNEDSLFKIVKADEAKVEVNVSKGEGWSTLILPFNVKAGDLQGLKAYTWGSVTTESKALELNEESDGIKANTPYIVYGEGSTYTFSGYGLATKDSYETEFMTGVYAADSTDVPEGSYVLGNWNESEGGDGVAFYKVGANPIKLGPYKAYVNASAVAGINAQVLKFPTRDLPSHVTAATVEAATVDVYSVSGILVRSKVAAGEALEGLPKGVYIVNGEKKAVK